MVNKIDTVDDVKTFFNELNQESSNFHPDSDFTDYVHVETNKAIYTVEEAQVRNELLEQAFNVCGREGADIYELGMDIFLADFYKEFPKEI
jgi:hypothetical protein